MINIINTASDAMITPSTVADVGICYYDYEAESIMELSSIAINTCSVSPISPILKKYYLICTIPLTEVSVSIDARIDAQMYFGAKIISNEIEPSIADFDNLIEFNTARVLNPPLDHLIPVWVLLYPKVNSTINLQMEIKIEAE